MTVDIPLTPEMIVERTDAGLRAVAAEYPVDDMSPMALRKRLGAYRDVLVECRKQIANEYERTRAGLGVAHLLTALVDGYVRHAWNLYVGQGAEIADVMVVALGGYGRCELNPFSDVDILCVIDSEITGLYDPQISDMLQFLWDMNFDLGHSTRTMDECLESSAEDDQFATALLDSRFVVGDALLWDTFRDHCRTWRGKEAGRSLLLQKIEERTRRLAQFHNTVQIQEPDIKECPGTLRDIHLARWLAMLNGCGSSVDGLARCGVLTEREAGYFTEDLDFFLRVRHALHFSGGKRYDRLDHLILPDVARYAGYEGVEAGPAESLMRDYYMRAGRIRRLADRVALDIMEREINGNTVVYSKVDSFFQVSSRDIRFSEDARESLDMHPELIVRLAVEAGNRGCSIAGETQRDIEMMLEKNEGTFVENSSVRTEFHALFNRKTGVAHSLRLLHEMGMLTRIVPEFEPISWHYQYDYYHMYTTDEHSIRVVENLERMASGRMSGLQELAEMMRDVTARGALYIAGFLHDVAKPEGSGHAYRGEIVAAKALKRLGYDRRTIGLVRFLIRAHLLMSHVSQRRDIEDGETVADFVRQIGSAGRLRMLTLLTFADLMALSEGALTDWKKALMRGLYNKSLMLIERGYESRIAALRTQDIDRIVHTLESRYPAEEVLDHLEKLPDQYFRVNSRRAIGSHMKGIGHMKKKGVWASFRHRDDVTLLTVIMQDHPRALADICGTITASDININGARIFTRDDGILIDTFLVTDAEGASCIPSETQRAFKENIARVANEGVEVKGLIRSHYRRWRRRRRNAVYSPPRVRVLNDVSSRYTVVDVFATDYTGLLYDITSAFAALDIDIHTARIGTDEDQVADAFYIQTADGEKIEEKNAVELLRSVLIERLTTAVQ